MSIAQTHNMTHNRRHGDTPGVGKAHLEPGSRHHKPFEKVMSKYRMKAGFDLSEYAQCVDRVLRIASI